ncbi:MAG: polysaccharide biosynthesis/export family protein [Candidatus Binatia bacterium]|nr:polysaccharide biosynthesis/export family protein [Candidatus Binatia bacterium]
MHNKPYSACDKDTGWQRFITTFLVVVVAVGGSACGPSTRQQHQQAQAQLMLQHGDGAESPMGASTAFAPAPDFDDYSYRLAPGDIIDIKFPYHPEENERVPVRPDGMIDLQVVGDIDAAGMTVAELEAEIVALASRTLRDPVVSVVIAQLAEHKVYVGGDVLRPGFVNYRDGLTPLQAVIERGGFTDTAKSDEVLYITRIGEEIQAQRLDLESIIDGDSTGEVIMAPDDVVFVPKTFIGKADVWVDQWIRGLLPTVPRPGFDLNSVAF